jgi:hypothetical protein
VGRGNLNEPSDKSVINVHQHFNQPNIMNFNHNDYFDKAKDKTKNMEDSLHDTFYPCNPTNNENADSESSTIQRGTTAIIQNRRRIVSSINPGSSKNSKSHFYKQLQPFLRASSTQNLQSHLQRRKERPNSLIRHLKGANPSRYSMKRQQIDRVCEIIENRRLRNMSVGHSSLKKQEHLNYLDPSLVNFKGNITEMDARSNSQATLFS